MDRVERRFLRYLRATRETFGPVGRAWAEDAYRASVDADMVLAHPYAMGATFAAEAKGRPAAVIALPIGSSATSGTRARTPATQKTSP